MTNYRRVTERDRYQIQAWLQSKVSVGQISQWLGFNRSSIYREIERNGGKNYQAQDAQNLSQQRYRSCRRKYKITQEIQRHVVDKLKQDWSPEQIEVRYKLENKTMVSCSTIYRFVQRHRYRLGKYHQYLRWYNRRGAGRARQRRRIEELGRPIALRSSCANERRQLGHWERDTMYVQNHEQLLVCTDRKSRFTRLDILMKKDTSSVADQTQRMLKQLPYQTMTNDNGPEFRSKKDIGVPVYFCEPRKPQQRGTVENTIGLLRQYIKRKTNIQELTPQKIQWIQDRLNHRPRKCLDFKTPYEIFFKTNVALAMIT